MLRLLVALVAHAPGLWLFYREPLPTALRRPNLIAVGLTLIAMAVAALTAPAGARALPVLGLWAAGHFAWGAYLCARLPRASAAQSGGK
jgi:hypothetical protein